MHCDLNLACAGHDATAEKESSQECPNVSAVICRIMRSNFEVPLKVACYIRANPRNFQSFPTDASALDCRFEKIIMSSRFDPNVVGLFDKNRGKTAFFKLFNLKPQFL